jgi:uncharacterized protein (DUF2336 family)
MLQDDPLFAELEATLNQGSRPKRFAILRKMTDLFLAGVDTYSDEHIAVFDELMGRLIEKIERRALVELSGRLAPAERAPINVIGRLSHDNDIEISGPILEKSRALTDRDLVEIAQTKSQAHLSAIASRAHINEQVTDVLIHRGDSNVARKVTANRGARFSRFGLDKAVARAAGDESLALVVANRADLPLDLLDRLIDKATETVRQRLLANAHPDMRDRIAEVVAKVSGQVAHAVAPGAAKTAAKTAAWLEPSRLRARVAQCAEDKKLDELVGAFSALAEVPARTIWDLIRQTSDEGLLILGKACGLGWPDMHKVLSATMPAKAGNDLFEKFTSLSAANAQRAVRFIRSNTSRSKDELRLSA